MDKSPSGSAASSPLSMADSEAFDAEEYLQHEMAQIPPAKRQKLEDGSVRATSASHDVEYDALSSISSDTSGDIPQSPSAGRADDDEVHEQVTVCLWEGCNGRDLGNMDRLVEHIHNDHIEGRHKKYTCEWEDCSRKSMPHASGYALRAHVRSHTREKPFYCALPGNSNPP